MKEQNPGSSSKKLKKRSGQKRPKTPRSGTPKGIPDIDSSSRQTSREQRKIERILESFRKMDEKSSRKKGSSGPEGRPGKRIDKKEFISNSMRRGRPRRGGKRKADRHSDEPHGVVPVGRLIEHSPMYFGRKAWLMRLYRRDQQVKDLRGFEHLVDRGIPFHKRVLQTYVAQQEQVSRNFIQVDAHAPAPNVKRNGDDNQERIPAKTEMDVESRSQKVLNHNGVTSNKAASIHKKLSMSRKMKHNGHYKESRVVENFSAKNAIIQTNGLNGHAMHVTTTTI